MRILEEDVRRGSFDVIIEERPWTINTDKRAHWAREKDVAHWKSLGGDMVTLLRAGRYQAPSRVDRFTVSARQLAQDGRHHQDVGNCYPAVKAFVDGAVLAGWCDDDNDNHMREIAFRPCHVAGYNGIQLSFTWELDL